MANTKVEGMMTSEGGWMPAEGSRHRRLTKDEVADLKTMAKKTTPSFEGPHNTPWEDHHPIAREIWAKRPPLTDAELRSQSEAYVDAWLTADKTRVSEDEIPHQRSITPAQREKRILKRMEELKTLDAALHTKAA